VVTASFGLVAAAHILRKLAAEQPLTDQAAPPANQVA